MIKKENNNIQNDKKIKTLSNKKQRVFVVVWNWIKNNKPAVIMFVLLLLIQQLSYTGNAILNRAGAEVYIPLDYKIPLITEFSWIYLLTFPLVIFAYFWIAVKDKKHLYNVWLTAMISFFISGLFYVFFQTQIIKPTINPVTISDHLAVWIYNHCRPINCFPSQHVMMALLIQLAFYNQRKTTPMWLIILNIISGVLITLSTVFLKQHFVVDIFASIAITVPVYIIVKTWHFGEHMEKKMAEWAEKKAIKQAIANETKTFASENLEEQKIQTLGTTVVEEKTNNATQETDESQNEIDKTVQENESTLTADELKNITSQDDNNNNNIA